MRAEELKGHLDAMLLAALECGPRHGYAVMEGLRQSTGREPKGEGEAEGGRQGAAQTHLRALERGAQRAKTNRSDFTQLARAPRRLS